MSGMIASAAKGLVFTDLDGTLLDHDTYRFDAALPVVEELERRSIPLIFCSSKTRVEIEFLRGKLFNRHPFIVENGAAVYVPGAYFAAAPGNTTLRDGFHVREMSPRRERWLSVLNELTPDFGDEFISFSRAGVKGIMEMTGLDEEAARAAQQREFSEPVKWLGSDARRELFISELKARGAAPLQGGRFLGVTGASDKGRALAWLREVYGRQTGRPVHDLAAGDSANDCAMLETAETALWVRSPVHGFPSLQRRDGILYSEKTAPDGWAEGVTRWLATVFGPL